jgi:hypothetical protein
MTDRMTDRKNSLPGLRKGGLVVFAALVTGSVVYGVRSHRSRIESPHVPASPETASVQPEIARTEGIAAGKALLARLTGAAPRFAHPLPPPSYRARAAEEWQGMLVDEVRQAECDGTARCSLALACVASRCGACRSDSDCLGEEGCVLDHCVLRDRIDCKRRRDCGADEQCVLSEFGTDARGNATMNAFCRPNSGGREENKADPSVLAEVAGPRHEGAIRLEDLRESLNRGD